MKWPASLLLIRHDVSEYNQLRERKKHSAVYQKFLRAFENNPESAAAKVLAEAVAAEFTLGVSDADTELIDADARRAEQTGFILRKSDEELPDVIFVSPYKRTKSTLAGLMRGWPELKDVRVIEEERLREQEHGLSLLYNDWRVFHALHPEQRKLYELEGPYWYRYPQGENVPDVRERGRSWTRTLVRDFAGKHAWGITHHLNILGLRANYERWDADTFIRVDRDDKPINCGVTIYRGDTHEGTDGRLKLAHYNLRLYNAEHTQKT